MSFPVLVNALPTTSAVEFSPVTESTGPRSTNAVRRERDSSGSNRNVDFRLSLRSGAAIPYHRQILDETAMESPRAENRTHELVYARFQGPAPGAWPASDVDALWQGRIAGDPAFRNSSPDL